MKAGIALLGSMTIPGRPEYAAAARAFVTRTLADGAHTDTAVLLTSELVTNSLRHSRSRHAGGTITITLIATPDGIRAEVADDGADTGPALRPGDDGPPDLAEDGRGLFLVDTLADRWDCWRDATGTVTWFELIHAAP
jgi:anti-sigma regulatory factor (Ser/Thr protein kinase)